MPAWAGALIDLAVKLIAKIAGALAIYQAGKRKAELNQAETALEKAKEADEVHGDVARMPDDAVARELRDKWTRRRVPAVRSNLS
jgi:hypothetical protein